MSNSSQFLRELRQRKVFRTAAIYTIAAWVTLQVADLAFPGLGVPERAIRYVWIGAFLGFPLAVVFGWLYQITPQGIVRSAPLVADEAADHSLKRTDYVLLTVFAIAIGGIIFGLLGEIRKVETGDPFDTTVREIHSNSVAVLPLSNLTGDPDQEYFVDGMHEALTAVLAQISALKVISRTSTSVYKDATRLLPDIGRELGVANIVEGSVFRSGDKVRITVQLINQRTDGRAPLGRKLRARSEGCAVFAIRSGAGDSGTNSSQVDASRRTAADKPRSGRSRDISGVSQGRLLSESVHARGLCEGSRILA